MAVLGAAALNAGVFALANWALHLVDKQTAAEEKERHDRALEKYQKQRANLDAEMEKHRLKLERERDELEKAGIDIDEADKDLYTFFHVSEPQFEYTPGTKQKIAQGFVVGGIVIGAIEIGRRFL